MSTNYSDMAQAAAFRGICEVLGIPSQDPTSSILGFRAYVARVKDLEARNAVLAAWLESRGLPATWAGALDAWGWVVCRSDGMVRGVVCTSDGCDHGARALIMAGRCWPTDDIAVIRWDHITTKQRAAALALR